MSNSLIIILIVFSLFWILLLLKMVRDSKLSIKYSMVWFFMTLVILIVSLLPNFMSKIAHALGFEVTSSLVIGILLTLLLLITLYLTIIVTNQKTQINKLIQEISILKKDK